MRQNAMNDIEIEHQCYCAENGMFCPFMDGRSGLCIATSCKWAIERMQQAEIERRAHVAKELKDGYFEIKEDRYARALEQIAVYGATMIDLDIDMEELL